MRMGVKGNGAVSREVLQRLLEMRGGVWVCGTVTPFKCVWKERFQVRERGCVSVNGGIWEQDWRI